jgi:bacteriocin biosynthesis cyclodehydratase domain-containing protein
VHGHSQLTALIASVLAASGVGSVRLVANGEASAADACPGGLLPSDEGRRFASAARDAVRRAAPAANLGPDPGGQPSDVVVLTDPGPVDPAVRSALHLDQRTHLSVSVHAGQAIVGPLVVPGLTSCLRCADLHRCDRDPAWPLLAIQLSRTGRRRPAQDAALCVSTAGLAASQILAFLDRQEPASTSATLEWQPPDWRLRRRGWPPHPDCDCGAATPEASTRHNEVVIMR